MHCDRRGILGNVLPFAHSVAFQSINWRGFFLSILPIKPQLLGIRTIPFPQLLTQFLANGRYPIYVYLKKINDSERSEV